MAKLTAKTRNALPAKAFAGPDRSFPINDPGHARNALARVANRSPELKAKVRAKVQAKYPTMGKKARGGLVGGTDGSSDSMARGGSALSAASVVTHAAADTECDG